MYINKPLLEGSPKRRPSRPLTDFSRSQKKNELEVEIQAIESEWQRVVGGLEQEVGRARRMNIELDDDEAYLRCCNLLQEEFQAEEDKFIKMRRKLKISIQSVEEHMDVCSGEKAQREKELAIVGEEIKQLQVEAGKVSKRHRKVQQLRDQIQQQANFIEKGNVKLQELKERSYEQKSFYLQTQQEEMALMQELARCEEQEQIYYDYRGREEKYLQLSAILEKLHNRSSYSNRDVEAYLKERISDMSVLRANLLTIDDKLDEFDVLLQEQNYIIEGLKFKSQNVAEVEDSAFHKYKSKYEELYFNRNNNLENWKSYKHYLQELLNRNKIHHHLREDPENRRKHAVSSYARPVLKTEPNVFEDIEEEPSLSPSFNNIKTPQMRKKTSDRLSVPARERGEVRSVKLPTLVKMKGESLGGMKQDLKSNIKKMMNESDISLQSVDSNEENMSGQFIEVEFHKK